MLYLGAMLPAPKRFDIEHRLSDSPLVEAVWRTRSESAGSFISTADARSEIVVTRYRGQTTLTVRGPETKATIAHFPAETEFFGMVLKLGTYLPHLPASLLKDRRDLTLPEASSQSFWLQGAAWQFPTFDNADTFIERLARESLLTREPVVEAALRGQALALSVRAVQYRFVHATGLTQRLVHQIERAQQAASLLNQGESILDTVEEAGYFDQAHLTRSLKRFVGQTPTQILQPE